MTESPITSRENGIDELVVAARTNRESFGQLFDWFYPSVFAYCLRRLLVRAVAEDVTSEIFLNVAVGIRSFTGRTTEDFRRWLFRIATNEINAQLRKSLRRAELLEEAARLGNVKNVKTEVSTVLTGNDFPVEWSSVYEALGELNEQEQTVVSLRFFSELKHDQIGDVLGIKTGTVRVTLSRALNTLRDRLRTTDLPSPPVAPRGGHSHE